MCDGRKPLGNVGEWERDWKGLGHFRRRDDGRSMIAQQEISPEAHESVSLSWSFSSCLTSLVVSSAFSRLVRVPTIMVGPYHAVCRAWGSQAAGVLSGRHFICEVIYYADGF